MENRTEKSKSRRKFKKVSVSFEAKTLPAAKARAVELGHKASFSAYIQRLIDEDLGRSERGTEAPSEHTQEVRRFKPGAHQ